MRLLISGKAVVELNGRSIKNLRTSAYKELLIKLLEEGHKEKLLASCCTWSILLFITPILSTVAV
jgi:hypothetical protein